MSFESLPNFSGLSGPYQAIFARSRCMWANILSLINP